MGVGDANAHKEPFATTTDFASHPVIIGLAKLLARQAVADWGCTNDFPQNVEEQVRFFHKK